MKEVRCILEKLDIIFHMASTHMFLEQQFSFEWCPLLPSPQCSAFISLHLHISPDLLELPTQHGFLSQNMTGGFFPLRFSRQNIKIRPASSDIFPSPGDLAIDDEPPHKLPAFICTFCDSFFFPS